MTAGVQILENLDNRFNTEHNLSQGKELSLCVCPCTGRLDNP